MVKIILLDWVKNNVASSRVYGTDWFYSKEGVQQLLKRCNAFKSIDFQITVVINSSDFEGEYDYLIGNYNIEEVIYNPSNIGHDWGGIILGLIICVSIISMEM